MKYETKAFEILNLFLISDILNKFYITFSFRKHSVKCKENIEIIICVYVIEHTITPKRYFRLNSRLENMFLTTVARSINFCKNWPSYKYLTHFQTDYIGKIAKKL